VPQSTAGRVSEHILDEVVLIQVDGNESEAVQGEEGAERRVGFVVKDTQGAVEGERVCLGGLKVVRGGEEGCEMLIGNLADREGGAVDAKEATRSYRELSFLPST